MSYYDKQVDFHSLIGQTITELSTGDDTHITTNTGKYIIYHSQDCCESVHLQRVIGNIDDVPFDIRVNNEKAGRIETATGNQNVSIGYQSL